MNDDQNNNKQQPLIAHNSNGQKNYSRWLRLGGIGFGVLITFFILFRFIIENSIINWLLELSKNKPDIFWTMLVCGLFAVLFFFIGIAVALLLRQIWKDVPHIASEIKKDHKCNQSTFKSWLLKANGILSKAEQGALREMWLSQPWEYMKEIEEADAKLGKNAHISSISLYGTMVGFAFLLPEALRSHLCHVKNDFRTLSIFASDAEITINAENKSLVNYPLWLTAQFLLKLLECKSFEDLFKDINYKFIIKIVYLPYDLISAVIYLPPQEIAILQALDKNGLGRILNEIESQVGFRYVNTPGEGPYERFAAAMNNIESANKVKRNIEIWEIAEGKIKIKNPHWSYEKDRMKANLIISSSEYDDIKKTNPEFSIELTGESEIKKCMEELVIAIKNEPSSGPDVVSLDTLAIKKKEDWQRRQYMKCPCGGRKQQVTEKKIKKNKAGNQ